MSSEIVSALRVAAKAADEYEALAAEIESKRETLNNALDVLYSALQAAASAES